MDTDVVAPIAMAAGLGWAPTMTLEQLCKQMVEADLRRVDQGWMF